jgi:hypothetical protein
MRHILRVPSSWLRAKAYGLKGVPQRIASSDELAAKCVCHLGANAICCGSASPIAAGSLSPQLFKGHPGLKEARR